MLFAHRSDPERQFVADRRHLWQAGSILSNVAWDKGGKCGLSTYHWQDADGGLHFCPTCGTTMMRTGYRDGHIALNARCLEGADIFAFEVARYDGRNLMPPGPTL
jgi:hypothetical protein